MGGVTEGAEKVTLGFEKNMGVGRELAAKPSREELKTCLVCRRGGGKGPGTKSLSPLKFLVGLWVGGLAGMWKSKNGHGKARRLQVFPVRKTFGQGCTDW